jgi:hypothetical protein
MDTVTYPDPSLKELLAKFVLVKVDHDADAALVKQYGVQPLPDVRVIAPDGKQLDRLVGFTSASRLAARLQRALDRLAGSSPDDDAPAAEAGRDKPAPLAVEATPEAIGRAVLRGASFLRGAWRVGWTAPPRFAPDELVLFAWTATGLRRTDADVAALLGEVAGAPPAGTYRAALRACALQRLGGADLLPKLEECARLLSNSQLANGQWTYGAPEGADVPALGDGSNSAYALLGLAACRTAGVAVPRETIANAARAWQHVQNEDGGFGYRSDRESASYASMTASGLHCLLLARDRFGVDDSPAIARAESWLRQHFSPRENAGSAYQEGRLLYGLFAIERVGDECAVEGERGHDAAPEGWYRQGADFLLATQHDDGSWDDGAETPIPNTCFALLFLTRASEALR